MPKVFLSYRRDDTFDIVGRLFDRLQATEGWESVFVDVESIPAGTDFSEYITAKISDCQVLVAVIGRNWIGIDESGNRKIDRQDDFVRVEVGAALRSGICVIPVLVHGSRVPEKTQLPETLNRLPDLNAIDVDSGVDFHLHVDRLIRHVDQQVNAAAYDAIQRFRARSEATGKVELEMITKDGRLVTTTDGRGYSILDQFRDECSEWRRDDLYELVLMLRNVTRDRYVVVNETLAIDASKTDVQRRWPIRLDQGLKDSRKRSDVESEPEPLSAAEDSLKPIILSRREIARWNRQFPEDNWGPFDEEEREVDSGCLLKHDGPQFFGVQEVNACLKKGYAVSSLKGGGSFVDMRYTVPDGNHFSDYTGGFIKVQLSLADAPLAEASSNIEKERQVNFGSQLLPDGIHFFGTEEIESLLENGYELICLEEGGLFMDTRYEQPDGNHGGDFRGWWVVATLGLGQS